MYRLAVGTYFSMANGFSVMTFRCTAAAKSAGKPAADRPKASPTDTRIRHHVSLLDAAAIVLADAKAPMQAKAIVDKVVERGMWKPGEGATPHATLCAAMTREIVNKGDASRFRKVDRGRFAAGSHA